MGARTDGDPNAGPLISRRGLLRGAGTAAGLLALGVPRALGAPPPVPTLHSELIAPHGPLRKFHSAPDLRPPTVVVTGSGAAPGYLFAGPQTKGGELRSGPLIVDELGEPVYFKPLERHHWVTNLRAQSYRGAPALCWWEGKVLPPGFGHGEGVIVDSSYRELARIRAAHGHTIDLHELLLTPEGTALFTCHPPIVPADLSSIGGPRDGHVFESVIQEVDVRTGRLLFEWRSLDHIPVSESLLPLADPYDYVHINSIDIAPDGNLLLSARHAWTLYKIDRRTGAVIWRLGGKRSDFHVGPEARFSWQHDARYAPGGTITLFDNGSEAYTPTERGSRALVLDIDPHGRTVRLNRGYAHEPPLIVSAMGSVQTLPGGRLLVGWGTSPVMTEFTPGGTAVAEARLAPGRETYRGFRFPWAGAPSESPQLAARRSRGSGELTLFVSWNGATAVDSWLISTGSTAAHLAPIGVAARQGFETAISLGAAGGGWVSATALDARGAAIGQSKPARI